MLIKELLFTGVAFVETVNATGGVNQFLFAREKRMTLRADFDMQLVLHRRACREMISARADDVDFLVVRMNFSFHFLFLPVSLFRIRAAAQTSILLLNHLKGKPLAR